MKKLNLKFGGFVKILFGLISINLFAFHLFALQSGEKLLEALQRNVVQITAIQENGEDEHGFGFIIGKRAGKFYIVTADHVVRDYSSPGEKEAKTVEIKFFEDQGQTYQSTLLESRKRKPHDLAVILVDIPDGLSFAEDTVATKESVKRNTNVWFIGRDRQWFIPIMPGKINSRQPDTYSRIDIENVSAVKRGTSGAPLISEDGIVGMIIMDEGEGFAWAITIDFIQNSFKEWNFPWSLKNREATAPDEDPELLKTCAVLPFRNISANPRWDNWREGLTEELITVLKNAKTLQLVERGTSAKYKNLDALNLKEVGSDLNVKLVLLGSYDVIEDDGDAKIIIIRARLVETKTGSLLDTFKVEGEIGYAVQVEMAEKIMHRLNVRPTSYKEVRRIPTTNVDALDYVRIGIHHIDTEDYVKALNAFHEALKLDPEYCDAHFYLGVTYKTIKSYDKALEQFKDALGNAYDKGFGKLLWSFKTNQKIYAKPTLDNKTVYIGTEGNIFYAIDKHNKKLKWRQRLDSGIMSGAFIEGSQIFVASEHQVYSLNSSNGEIRWKFGIDGEAQKDLVGSPNTLYVATNKEIDDQNTLGTLYALNTKTGTLKWRYNLEKKIGAPIATEKKVIFGSGDEHLYTLNEEDGTLIWKRKAKGTIEHAPAIEGKNVYLAANGYIYALDLETGQNIWNPLETGTFASCSPSIDKGVIYVSFDYKLYAINGQNGVLKWIYEDQDNIGSVIASDGLVFIMSKYYSFFEEGEHVLRAIDQETRQTYWRYKFSDSIYGEGVIEEGVLYIGNRNHNIYAFNVNRTNVGQVKSAEIWNKIGQIHYLRNDYNAAIKALNHSIEVDPTYKDPYRNLFKIYKKEKRIAKAIKLQQDYIQLLSGAEKLEAEEELYKVSGLKWKFKTPRLRAIQLFPIIGPPKDDELDLSPIVPFPVVSKEIFYIGASDGSMNAIDTSTHQPRWIFDQDKSGKSIRSSAVIWKSGVFFGSGNGYIYALDVDTGSVNWKFKTDGRVDSTPTIVSGVLYIGSDDGFVYALNADNGNLVWHFPTDGRIKSSPVVINGTLFIGSYDGMLYAFDVENGKLKWYFQTNDIINSSPRVSDGYVFLGPDDNFVYALNAETGILKWKFEVKEGAKSALKYGIVNEEGLSTFGFLPSSPVIQEGVVYVGSNGSIPSQVYAIDSESGQLKWRFPVDNGEVSSPVIYKNVLFVGAGGIQFHDQYIYGLSLKDGSLLWKYKANGDILSAPFVLEDELYFWSLDGSLYAFDINDVPSYSPEKDSAFYVREGNVSLENNKMDAAMNKFKIARDLDPKNPDAHAGLADCYNKLGEIKLEKETLEKFQELDPSKTHTYWRLGDLYLKLNMVNEAINQYKNYIMLQVESATVLGHTFLAAAYEEGQRIEEAIHEYNIAIEIGSRFILSKYGSQWDKDIAINGLILAFERKAKLHMQKDENLEDALDMDLLDKAGLILANPSPAYYRIYGYVHLQKKKYELAASAFELALEIEPKNVYSLFELTIIYHEYIFEFDKAYDISLQLCELFPDNLSITANHAEFSISAGKFEEARKLAGKIADESKEKSLILNAKLFLCIVSFLQKEETKAATELRDLIHFYESLPHDFKNTWQYAGTLKYINDQDNLGPTIKRMLIKMIDFLQGKIEKSVFESTIPQHLRR